jgi:phytoene/squalene synthetase
MTIIEGETYGNPTPLEIESPTLPPARFALHGLRPAYLPTPPDLPSLHRAACAGLRLRTLDNLSIKSHRRYRFIGKDDRVNAMISSPASTITKAASKQTYYTIRFLVDRARVEDAYRAYAYFRWVDDVLDADSGSDPGLSEVAAAERQAFLERQKFLLETCLRGEAPRDVNLQEKMLVELVQSDHEKSSGLLAYLRNMMLVMEFDVARRGRWISHVELNEYTRWLAIAVSEAMHYFIGNGAFTPRDETRYLAVSAAHITHMLRDTYDDVRAGYYNIPREVLDAHQIWPQEVQSDAYRAWVKSRVHLAREYFEAGREYFRRVQNPRHRLAGFAYMARFEWLLETIEREGFALRPQYQERKSIGIGLRMSWLALSSMLRLQGDAPVSRPIAPQR